MAYRIQEAPPKLRPYLSLGVNINPNGGEKVKGDCPLCGEVNKFGIIVETGQFSCFVCHQTGNIYTFMGLLHELAINNTTEEALGVLADQRNHSIRGLQRFGLAVNPLTDEWLVPGYNNHGKITDIYRIVQVSSGPRPKGSPPKLLLQSLPELKIAPFGHGLIPDNATDVYGTEGLWDSIALWEHAMEGIWLESPEATDPDFGILACPGSGIFQPDWFERVDGKNLHLCFDNDHPRKDEEGKVRLVKGKPVRPGWDGMDRIHTLIRKQPPNKPRPSSLRVIQWNLIEGHPSLLKVPDADPIAKYDGIGHTRLLASGYDLRDLRKASKGGFWSELQRLLVPITIDPPPKKESEAKAVPKVTPIPCPTFTELCTHYSSNLHFTQDLKDTLAVMLAVVYSTTLPEEQLWFRIIGPPGSGKSTLADAISAAREYVKPVSVMTGFHSGFVEYDERGRRKADASPLKKFMDKCLMTSDADSLVGSPNIGRIMSEARDLFGGKASTEYRNKVSDEFDGLRMSWIMCGTNALRSLNRTFLGERFLDCEILGKITDTSPFVKRAISNTYASLAGAMVATPKDGDKDHIRPDRLLKLSQATYGFLQHLKNTTPTIPDMPPEIGDLIEVHGNYVGFMRARVEREGTDLAYRPVLELPTRLAAQTTKLAFCLAIVLGKPSIDKDVFRIVKKVVFNSATGFQQEIAKAIADTEAGASVQRISITLNIPDTTIRRLLDDMSEFGLVRRRSVANNSGQRGRNVHMWELTPMLRSVWDIVHKSAYHKEGLLAAIRKINTTRSDLDHTDTLEENNGTPKPKPKAIRQNTKADRTRAQAPKAKGGAVRRRGS